MWNDDEFNACLSRIAFDRIADERAKRERAYFVTVAIGFLAVGLYLMLVHG